MDKGTYTKIKKCALK